MCNNQAFDPSFQEKILSSDFSLFSILVAILFGKVEQFG